MRQRDRSNVPFRILALCTALAGCGDDPIPYMPMAEDGGTLADASSTASVVHGLVTDVEGVPVADVVVKVGGVATRTDEKGRFRTAVEGDGEVQVAVESKGYSSGAAPVKVGTGSDAHVEVAVKRRETVTVQVASDGVNAEKDGVVVKVPANGLRTQAGAPVEGEVQVAVTVVKEPAQVAAAPGRMETDGATQLEGYGLVELTFFQGEEKLELAAEATVELPLAADAGLSEGAEVEAYALGRDDVRWKAGGTAKVRGEKLLLATRSTGWLGGARALPVDSCVAGRLLAAGSAAPNTTLRAARGRGLSLVQADTAADGSFCLPVTPDDDWSVSTYFDDGAAGLGLAVELRSSDAVGMCGGSGCKQVGDVELPALAP